MKHISATALRHLRSTLAQPGMIAVFTIMPLAFSLFFGSMFNQQDGPSQHRVAIVLAERVGPAQDFLTELETNPRLKVSLCSEEEAREMVEKRQVYGAFVFPSDFNARVESRESFTVTVWREGQANLIMAAQQEIDKSLRRVVASSVVAHMVGEGDQGTYYVALEAFQQEKVELKTETLSRNTDGEISNMSHMGLGMTIMFMMMSVVISGGVILDERQQGTWQRIMVTPVRKHSVLLGFMAGLFVVALVQFGLLAIVQSLLFKVRWGSMVYFIPFTSLFLLCALSLGLAMAGLVKTYTQQSSVASLVMTASAMMSGILWPLEIMPEFMQKVARVMPQYWAMVGFKSIMAGGSASSLILPAGVLLSITVLFTVFGVMRVRFE